MLNVMGLHVHQEFMYESISIDQTLSQYVHMCVCIIYGLVNVFFNTNCKIGNCLHTCQSNKNHET